MVTVTTHSAMSWQFQRNTSERAKIASREGTHREEERAVSSRNGARAYAFRPPHALSPSPKVGTTNSLTVVAHG